MCSVYTLSHILLCARAIMCLLFLSLSISLSLSLSLSLSSLLLCNKVIIYVLLLYVQDAPCQHS